MKHLENITLIRIAVAAAKFVAPLFFVAIVAVVWVFVITGGGVRVDGSRADCQRQFPGKQCYIIWVPEQ